MRLLVCGGRDYTDRDLVWRIVGRLNPAVLIQGGAAGADRLAKLWAESKGLVEIVTEPADWDLHGKAAGPMRNKLMLDKHEPDLVLAFPGGAGTDDMVAQARRAGVPVVRACPRLVEQQTLFA